MNFKDFKKIADKFFEEVSPDKIIKDFEKLGYEFSPSEELLFDLAPEAEGHFPIEQNLPFNQVLHKDSSFDDKQMGDDASVYAVAA